MKKRILVGSMFAVFLILLVPVTAATQIQTVKRDFSTTLVSYEKFKTMDAAELIVFIQHLAKEYPQLEHKFQRAVEEITSTLVSSQVLNDGITFLGKKNQGQQQQDDNQTVLEKIFWKIFNYRLFRVYLSALLFVYFQSKFTLLRTMTWGIRLLRWIKLGILLGFIDPSQQPPQTPDIGFQQDLENDTITVTYVAASVLWSDIAEIGAGSCDPFPEGNVTAGDLITNCAGIIVLQYLPTYEILGVFEFD
ncbi:MAG: hypothetical protein JXA75_03630 [Candidatus Thermoplasmatota archaeon]|nr:hypothetical protein [Candidatus Thermoplasmatota archaeon]